MQPELAKLERLARAHINEQHRLKRTAASAEAEAARLRASASRYDAAIARRVDTSGDRFSTEIDGRRYTKRVDAGEDLVAWLRRVAARLAERTWDHELHPRVVGRLSGFPLQLDAFTLGGAVEMRLTLMLDDEGGPDVRLGIDDLDDKRPDTVITQLEGRLRRLEDMRDRAVGAANDLERHATEARARIGSGFPDQPRLEHLRRRNQVIVDKLAADVDAPHEPASPPARDVEVRPGMVRVAARLERLRRYPPDSLERT